MTVIAGRCSIGTGCGREPSRRPSATTSAEPLRAAPGADRDLLASIDAAYAEFSAVPPDVAAWLAQWNGDANTFLRYMIEHLDAHASAVAARVEAIRDRLQVAVPA